MGSQTLRVMASLQLGAKGTWRWEKPGGQTSAEAVSPSCAHPYKEGSCATTHAEKGH